MQADLDHSLLLKEPVPIASEAFTQLIQKAGAACKADGGAYVEVWNNGKFQCRSAEECTDNPAGNKLPLLFRIL